MQVTDPVCGTKLDIDKATAYEDHRGWAYFFCSIQCRRSFETNPGRYVGEEQYRASWLGAAAADKETKHG
jgi:Cu+-exporting ATPase